jgi:hypothetical protein
MWATIVAFFKALPALIQLYDNIRELVGEAQYNSFVSDLTKLTDSSISIRQTIGLSFEEKRARRRELLLKSRDLWDRAIG